MPICPKCTSWLLKNEQNIEWVKCDQGHHFKKGDVQYEASTIQPPIRERRVKLPAGYEFDVRLNRWVYRGNWNT